MSKRRTVTNTLRAATVAVALLFSTSSAIAQPAHAQEQVYRIPVSDIDFSTYRGWTIFNGRVDVAAHYLCAPLHTRTSNLDDYQLCLDLVQDQARENLSDVRRRAARPNRLAEIEVRSPPTA